MSENIFDVLNHVFLHMAENKLRKDIDDTLFEKLITLFKRYQSEQSVFGDENVASLGKNYESISFDFIEELVKRTEALQLIEIVLTSVSRNSEDVYLPVKTFVLRFLGLIFESSKVLFGLQRLNKFSLFKDKNGKIITYYIPSIQDALLSLLSSITKQLDGVLWFINQNLDDFVFSSFNSTSYYVRKSAVNFCVNLISQWEYPKISEFEGKELELLQLEKYLKKVMSYITKQIHFYGSSKEIIFAECCISITKQLLGLRNIEKIMSCNLTLAESLGQCFKNLPEEDEFNEKLVDLFIAVHRNSRSKVTSEVVNEVIRSLIHRGDITLAFYLASSYARFAWSKYCSLAEVTFFLLPIYILSNKSVSSSELFFDIKSDVVYKIILSKMEEKTDCKGIFISSLSALQNLIPLLHPEHLKSLGMKILNIAKNPHCSYHFVLEDRRVHHSFVELFMSFLSEDVYSFFRYDESDIVFLIVTEFLKKPTSDVNFLSRLLLMMKDILILQEKFEYKLKNDEKDNLIEILSRMLLDNRESVVDSSIHLAGQILNNPAWQEQVSKQDTHSIIWDIAIQGNHDGSIRSTALKVIVESCLEPWCFNEIKTLKRISEVDVVEILFQLTHDPEFFLQREALSSLYLWVKSKWNVLSTYKDYLFSALISGIKSLDLEMKLLSLNIWLWFIHHKRVYIIAETSSDIQDYIQYLADCGFGLSISFALEDYDEAVRFKAADILYNLRKELISNGYSYDSLKMSSTIKKPKIDQIPSNAVKSFTEEERDKGISSVIKLTTTEQITNICRPLTLDEACHLKNQYLNADKEERNYPVESFWACLWSDKLASIFHPSKKLPNINLEMESLLNDIIAAKISEHYTVEETPDCY